MSIWSKLRSDSFAGSFLAALVLMIAVMVVACTSTNPTGEIQTTWKVNGTIAHNGSDNRVTVYIEIFRNDEAFISGVVSVADQSVRSLGDGTYFGNFSIADLDSLKSALQIKISTPVDQFQFQQQVDVPDAFTFAANGLTNNQIFSSTMVNLEWGTAFPAGSDGGYMLLAKQTSGSLSARGYQETLNGSEGTIPTDAFRSANGDFQAGTYNLWVVARSQQPVYFSGLPISFDDSVFSENIDRVGVTGQIGALYIPPPLEVTAVATIAP